MVEQRGSVSAEQAAEICGCSVKEVEEYRRSVLPRPPGAVPDAKQFSASEVVAIAAATRIKSWPCRKTALPFAARLALRPSNDREWLVVYQPRRGLRFEPSGFVLRIKYVNDRAGRIFDPSPFFDAFDRLEAASKAAEG